MTILETRDNIQKQGIVCDSCLGRQFHNMFKIDNTKIGAAIRLAKKESDIEKLLASKHKPSLPADCVICNGIFRDVDELFELLKKRASEIEFNTFLIGTSIPEAIKENEDKLWEKIGPEYCEPMKKEFNRVLGEKLLKQLDKKVDFDNPDVVFIVDVTKKKIFIQINALFIYGRYQKLERGLPQTRWPCRNCSGAGCKECGGTGKQFPETVEELIAESLVERTRAKSEKFHGHGREDRDARMLGKGRPFVLELTEPIYRNIDLEKIEKDINQANKDKIQVHDLRFSSKQEVKLLKTRMFNKTYHALVQCEGISKEDLKVLNASFNDVLLFQRTPSRVLHRRADKTRKRKVIFAKCKNAKDDMFECEINAEAGTYIKELISGDNGRTKPSFTEMISKPCVCKELDVINIEEWSDA